MLKLKYIIITSLLLSITMIWSFNGISADTQVDVTDSLVLSVEQRVDFLYGITGNTTLSAAAGILELDLITLKKQLGLDYKNTKLDKMKLSQIGVNVYKVLLAQETIQYGFNESSTLQDVSVFYSIPIKKLKTLLDLDTNNRSLNNRSLLSLSISLEKVESAKSEFNRSIFTIGNSISLVGVLVVFCALIFTSIIIAQLRHVNYKFKIPVKQADIIINKQGNLISSQQNIDSDEIIAVITALHIYARQLEERRMIALTFQRGQNNFWHLAGFNNMPNLMFRNKRK